MNLSTYPPNRLMALTRNQMFLRPHRALAQSVAHYTITFLALNRPGDFTFEKSGEFPIVTLLPDVSGCFVFDLEGKIGGRFWGATTKAVAMPLDYDAAPIRFFIEFLPGGAHQLLGIPMGQMTDQQYPIADVFPGLYGQILAVLQTEQNIAKILHEIEKILLHVMSSDTFPLDGLMQDLRQESMVSVKTIADASGYSERHLNRLFNQVLGVSIKTCVRIFRVNRVLSELAPGTALSHLAQSAGYYDQSHFNHDFKSVCGVSPTEYLASMSGFYKEDFKF